MNRKTKIGILIIGLLVILGGLFLGLRLKQNYTDLNRLEPRIIDVTGDTDTTIINMELAYDGTRPLMDYKTLLNYEPENYEVPNALASTSHVLHPGDKVNLQFVFPKAIIPEPEVEVYDLWFYFEGSFEGHSSINHVTSEGDLNSFIDY